ncbi:hypothetical protein BH11BAC3_BH11BAC3_40530 [soil metagenome]
MKGLRPNAAHKILFGINNATAVAMKKYRWYFKITQSGSKNVLIFYN